MLSKDIALKCSVSAGFKCVLTWLSQQQQGMQSMTGMLACRDEVSNQVLVLRWGAEQLEGARQALNAARAALKKLKAVEKKRKQKVSHKLHVPFKLPHPILDLPKSCRTKEPCNAILRSHGAAHVEQYEIPDTSTAWHFCFCETGEHSDSGVYESA